MRIHKEKTKVKYNSYYKYKLKLKKDGSIFETRLGTELKWKKKKHKRRTTSMYEHFGITNTPEERKALVRHKMQKIDITYMCTHGRW